MTGGTIIGLALGATALLVTGARLLDAQAPWALVLAWLTLGLGTALAATAVAGAWRTPVQQSGGQPSAGSEPGPTLSPSHSRSGRIARQSPRTNVSALRVPSSADKG